MKTYGTTKTASTNRSYSSGRPGGRGKSIDRSKDTSEWIPSAAIRAI